MTVAIAIGAGAFIGLALGALGGGGSVLAVPVLVYLLGQTAAQATTGSLVVVCCTATAGAIVAIRARTAEPVSGVVFGVLAIGGTAAGSTASARVSDAVLLASFSGLLLVVGMLMAGRRLRADRPARPRPSVRIVSIRPHFDCRCGRALRLLIAATAVGVLTGFLGVGGGFLVVPALILVLGLPADVATGTSLVVIGVSSAAALAIRSRSGISPDWTAVSALTAASMVTGAIGARVAARTDPARLSIAFTVMILLVAVYTAVRATAGLV